VPRALRFSDTSYVHPRHPCWLAVLLAACAPAPRDATCPEPPPSEIHHSFDDGTLESWPGTVERPDATSLDVSSTVTRRGGGAVSVRVRQGQLANGGTRAELAFDAGDRAGTTAYYAWSLRLAADWPDIDRVEDAAGRPNWQILGQFHDQPDCELGQTWDDYEGIGASPPVSVQYLWLTLEDPRVRAVFETGAASSVVGLDTSALERPLLGLFAGVPLELRAVAPIDKDRWHDVELAIHWSESDDGEVRFGLDGQDIATWRGRNMINAASHYFKVGLYRNPDITADQALWVDEVFVTHDASSMQRFAAELAGSRGP